VGDQLENIRALPTFKANKRFEKTTFLLKSCAGPDQKTAGVAVRNTGSEKQSLIYTEKTG
jgi:hypothetical protein